MFFAVKADPFASAQGKLFAFAQDDIVRGFFGGLLDQGGRTRGRITSTGADLKMCETAVTPERAYPKSSAGPVYNIAPNLCIIPLS